MNLNDLTIRQKNKLIKHYKTELSNLEVEPSSGIVRLKGGGNSIKYGRENIVITDNLIKLFQDIKKELKPNSILVLKNNNKNIKELIKLLTKDNSNFEITLFKLDKDSNIESHKHVSKKEYKKAKLSGDGLGSFFNGIACRVTGALGNVYNLSLEASESIPFVNSNKVPTTKQAYMMEKRSYTEEDQPELGDWKPIYRNKYLVVYRNDPLEAVCVAVRGTKPTDPTDLVADIRIALGRLKDSKRYLDDVKIIKNIQETYPPREWHWSAVGHSLGGAIIDELILDDLIKEGISFNPAIQKENYNDPLPNRRIYLDSDPLYKVMGRFTKYKEVREDKTDNSMLEAHGLDNFVGGGYALSPAGGGSRPSDGMVLHAVIVKKPLDIIEARKIAKHYIKGPKGFVRETKDSFRFRNIPKQKFIKSSFKTKVLNNCSLVFGILKK